jgi:hypothetical protein
LSLERKDVRLKISPAAHAELAALADFHEKEISEFASVVLERALLGEGHVIRLFAERAARLGKAGQRGDSQGLQGKEAIRRGK